MKYLSFKEKYEMKSDWHLSVLVHFYYPSLFHPFALGFRNVTQTLLKMNERMSELLMKGKKEGRHRVEWIGVKIWTLEKPYVNE